MHTPNPTSRHRTSANILAVAAIAMSMAFVPSTSALAVTPNVQAAADHYFYCLNLMLKDPAAHARECGPNLIATNNSSLATPITGAPPPPPPPKHECERNYD